MKTFSILGGISGPPSACSSAPNRIDVFAVGPGATVWRWPWDGTIWLAPAPLSPSQGEIPAEGVCAVSSGPGRVEVFAVAKSGVPVWWRGNGTGWTQGMPLPSGANLPAVALAAVCASPDNIDVFGAGAGNTPRWWHWNGAAWTARGALPSGATIPAERIAAVSAAPGRLDVFAVGTDTHLWHWSKVGPAPWGLEDLGGDLPAEGVSAVSWGPNRIDVFAASRAPGNPLQHWWSDGGGFSGPESFADPLGGGLAAGTVSAVSHAAGRLDVFGISRDKRIAHWEFDGQRHPGWNGPDFCGDTIPAGDVSAVVRAPHRLDVFVRGAGNTLRQWPGGGLENATTQSWSNWPTNQVANPVVGHLWPDSLDEVVTIVREAERLGRGVRAVGSSWSNSDVAVSPAYVVETDKLNRVLTDVLGTSLNDLGRTLRLVHVEAGIKLHALNDLLDDQGLALKTMGGSSGQSLAGVVSTSAHGHGHRSRTDPGHGPRDPPRGTGRRAALDRAERRHHPEGRAQDRTRSPRCQHPLRRRLVQFRAGVDGQHGNHLLAGHRGGSPIRPGQYVYDPRLVGGESEAEGDHADQTLSRTTGPCRSPSTHTRPAMALVPAISRRVPRPSPPGSTADQPCTPGLSGDSHRRCSSI